MKVYKFKCKDCGARKYIKLDGKNCQLYKCCYCGSIEEVFKFPKEELKKTEEPQNNNFNDIKTAELKLQKKKRLLTVALIELIVCFFLGSMGIHRFMQRKFLSGIVYMFTGGLFGIGVFIDILRGIVSVVNASSEYRATERDLYYIETERGLENEG